MLPPRFSIARIILNRRPLRPPNLKCIPPGLRLFTQNSQLLLVSRTPPRPELPYLYVSSVSRLPRAAPSTQYQGRLARYLTTERKQRIISETKLTVKYIIYFHVIAGFVLALVWLVSVEIKERRYPTPPEWSFKTRNIYRTARIMSEPNFNPSGITEWPQVGNNYWVALSRLEDPSIDGKDLQIPPGDDHRVFVVGINALGFTRNGLDLLSKSEEWRRGYYSVLMGAARAAEHLDEDVRDTKRNITFPKEHMIGPSNPRPKPVPHGAASPPLEENCVPASESPHMYYTKILTSTGFSTCQRLDAALAYADWLEFKGLRETAEEMYDWGLDIAMGALPVGVNNVVDTQTGIISNNAAYVSNNLLKATTALAIHHARNANLTAALPIFLSVLRAKKHLSLPPIPDAPKVEPTNLEWITSMAKSVLVTPPYPPAPPSGDEAPIRTPKAICEEAAVMAHIGEILFASSNDDPKLPLKALKSRSTSRNQESGLSWTRDAVDVSESTLTSMDRADLSGRQTCAECLRTGIDNWSAMVRKMLRDQQKSVSTKEQKVGNGRGWFWGGKSTAETEGDEGTWERELQLVDERMDKVQRLLEHEEESRKYRKPGGWLGLG
ncbi:MAG: hypothetical protein LQ337_000546 [Flavoplaca oasis]|nr:MAG: hypothetical protein LQ337_000546 [Flavoplaca oasis]